MNGNDIARFQQAVQLANAGQKQAAYNLLATMRNATNYYDIDLLFWIAFTTPSQIEGQQALDLVANIAPSHPDLPGARLDLARRFQPLAPVLHPVGYAMGPVLQCPYCHNRAPVRIERKISPAGWAVFAILLVTTLFLFWIGFFIKENFYVCSYCGMRLS